MGKVPNRAKRLTENEETILWESHRLGNSNPRSLLQFVWWNNCVHFGMRSREEDYDLKVEDFEFGVDSQNSFISFKEGLTKRRNKGLNFKPCLIQPKMYEANVEKCPCASFKKYLVRRPSSMKNEGPFYLAVIDSLKSQIWYK